MTSVDEVNEKIIKWLNLRLERANYVEKQLSILIKKKELGEDDMKRYNNLVFDSKNLSVKDVIAIYDALGQEKEEFGFEDFD